MNRDSLLVWMYRDDSGRVWHSVMNARDMRTVNAHDELLNDGCFSYTITTLRKVPTSLAKQVRVIRKRIRALKSKELNLLMKHKRELEPLTERDDVHLRKQGSK